MMNKQGILCSTEAYNILLEAVARIEGGDMGAYFTTCGEMIEANVPSDLHTYHTTLRACVRDDGMRSARQASVHTWRCFVKERPKIAPDIELMNLFISCALRYNDSDRAFFFLGVIDQWNLSPNALTFNLLLKVLVCVCHCVCVRICMCMYIHDLAYTLSFSLSFLSLSLSFFHSLFLSLSHSLDSTQCTHTLHFVFCCPCTYVRRPAGWKGTLRKRR